MSVADPTPPPALDAPSYVEGNVEQPQTPASENADEDEEMQDLFGEEAEDAELVEPQADMAEVSADAASDDAADDLSPTDRRHREAMEYPEEDEPEHVVEQILEANAAIPNIPAPHSSDGHFWVVRMPNFVKVDSKPFHSDTYVGPEQEDEEVQSTETLREKSMSIKLKVENTIRWRWIKDDNGNDKRQANARVVRWSDGSLSLQLGKELFDINQTVDTTAATVRQGPAGSQSQPGSQLSQSQQLSGNKAGGLTYLVAQHKRAEILQCEAVVTGFMSLRPTGMQSETHRMLVRAVGQKHNKVARLRMAPDPTFDPERERMELMKQAARKPRKPRGEDDGLAAVRRRRASYSRKRTDDMWSDDEEEEFGGGGGSEDEYGDGGSPSAKGRKGKRGVEDSAKKGPGEYQTDDFLVADSEEEAGSGDSDGERRPRKKSRRRAGEHVVDDLEKLDAKIELDQRKRRKTGGSDGEGEGEGEEGSAHSDAHMDVESEEEDDEFAVRRTRGAPGARKRRAIELDEEEDE